MAALPFDAEAWAREVGVETPCMEAGYSVLEASTVRPTLDCNGIWGGYTGGWSKDGIAIEGEREDFHATGT